MKTIFDEFMESWPFEVVKTVATSSTDINMNWFKSLSYDDMSKVIDNLSRQLGEMKRIRKTGLDKEIEATEKKLKRLKGNL